MTLSATEQAVLAVVQADLAQQAGPLVTFLQDIESADGNLGLEAAALLKLEGAAPAAGLMLGIQVQNQIVSFALTKLNAYIASKAPAQSSASAPAAAKPA
jgi:hypothetical protein